MPSRIHRGTHQRTEEHTMLITLHEFHGEWNYTIEPAEE
jgi:hypothetical protein